MSEVEATVDQTIFLDVVISRGVAVNVTLLQGATGPAGPSTVDEDVEITDATKGLILRDSGGTRYRVTIDTGGALNITTL